MQARVQPGRWLDWFKSHVVELAFCLLVVGWIVYALRITKDYSFWSDDLLLVDAAGSWSGLLDPYNAHLSIVILLIYRAVAEVSGLSFTGYMIAGTLSLALVPLSYFFTTRRQFGAPLAAVLAVPLLWYSVTNLRPAALNHWLMLVGGIVCAAALNRGRRADWVLAAALAFSLASAGGGVIVAGACILHSIMVRPHWRRWLAIAVPTALYALWYLITSPSDVTHETLTLGATAREVLDLSFEPFSQFTFGFKPLAALLVIAFFGWGFLQLRQGLVAGANFVTWTVAMLGWGYALIKARGSEVDPEVFRYAYVSLAFALLAIVPRRPITWPERYAPTNRRWLAAAAVIMLVLGGLHFVDARRGLQEFASKYTDMGRQADGTVLIAGLGPKVLADNRPIVVYGIDAPHGTAKDLRRLIRRYGSPFDATFTTVDQDLVDLNIVRARIRTPNQHPGCTRLTAPTLVLPSTYRELDLGPPVDGPQSLTNRPLQHQLWSDQPYTVEVRRFGDHWVHLKDVPAGRDVILNLPALNSQAPWGIRANGACVIPYGTQ